MSAETRWVVGTGAAVMLSVLGSAVAVIAVMVTLVGDVRADLGGRMDRIEDRMNRIEDRLEGFDERLRAVEVAFGKVDQRLATLERAILPAAPPAD